MKPEEKLNGNNIPATKQEFLRKELVNLLDHYDKERSRHKKEAMFLKISTVALSASITILLGLKGLDQLDNWLKNIALFLGAAITVINAYEAFFYPRTLWIQDTKVYTRLKDINRQLGYMEFDKKGDAINNDGLDKIKIRLDKVLQESLNDWLMLRGVTESVHKPEEDKEANKNRDQI